MRMCQTSLNISYWNTNKLISKHCDKTVDKLMLKNIQKSDVICLAETKCDLNGKNFENFVFHFKNRDEKPGKQVYGGLAFLIRKHLRKGIKYLPCTSSEYQWLIFDKDFFGV